MLLSYRRNLNISGRKNERISKERRGTMTNPGLYGCLRCRARSYVSRGWVGLPPDFHWAKNSEKPQDSEFSQQRLRELLESSLRSPEENLPEAPPIPDIRYIFVRQLNCSFGFTYDFEFKPECQWYKYTYNSDSEFTYYKITSNSYRQIKLVPPKRFASKVHFTERWTEYFGR